MATRIISSCRPDREPVPTRRSLLSFLTATVAAAPVAAVAASLPRAPATQEIPEILAFGERLPALREACKAAAFEKEAALKVYEHLRPTVPDELFQKPEDRGAGLADAVDLVDVHGEWQPLQHRVYRSKLLRAHIILQEVSAHTKRGKRLRRLVRVAKKHEAATAEALRVSEFYERCDDLNKAGRDLEEFTHGLAAFTPLTMEGVMIYANTVMAITEHFGEHESRGWAFVAQAGVRMVDAMLRIQAARESANA